jgi:hypothetical protein
MLKSIKKSLKYLAILIGIILLVPTSFSLVLRLPEVQTLIVWRITGYLSDRINATISIGKFNYSFFNKLELSDVLFKDQNNDTLLYTHKITAGILNFDFGVKAIRLGQIELAEPTIYLITDTSGLMNLTWALDKLSSSDSSGNKSSNQVSVKSIKIREGRFMLIDKRDSVTNMKINFSNLHLTGINCELDDFQAGNDSTTFRINDLEFAESNGFLVRSMNCRTVFSNKDIIFRDLFLYLDSSIINAEHIIIAPEKSGSFRNFSDEVRLNIAFQRSLISSADLKYFIPSVNNLGLSMELSGKVSGTIAELKGRNIRVKYKNYSNLDCDFDFSGLPQFEDAFIHIKVNNLNTNVKDFEGMRLPGKPDFNLPEVLYKMGNITFNGYFTGFITDFVTYGKLGTEIGIISTDISLRPEEKSGFRIKGLVRGSNVDLGQLTNNSELFGRLNMEMNIDGLATSSKKISGNLTGKIDSIEVNRYVYRNVALNGIFTEKTWDGDIKISDNNIKMDMLGLLDFSNELPEFNLTLNLSDADLYKLNFDKNDPTANISMLVTANFKGNNIDNLFGEIRMINSTLRKNNNKLDLYNFSLKAFNEDNKPAISLRTDFIDADLRGYYEFGELGNVIKIALASLMPSRFKMPVVDNRHSRNEFNFALNFKNTEKINNFFKTGIQMSDKSSVTGSFYQDSIIRINVNSKMFNYRNNVFKNLAINADYSGDKFTADLRSTSLSVLGQSELKDFKAGFYTQPDNFTLNFNWDNREKIIQKGEFTARGSFSKKEAGQEGSLLKIEFDSSDIYTSNNIWKIRQSSLSIDSGRTQIERFIVAGKNNSFSIDGKVSANPKDTLKMEFKGIDLSPLTQMGKKENEKDNSGLQFNTKGIVNGNIFISSALKNPLIESNITVNGFSILGGDYGDISIKSEWNPERKVAEINASNNLKGRKNIEIKGIYDPKIKKFNLAGNSLNLPVDALNPLLSFFASGINGTVSGKVNLTGAPGELYLTGALMAENISMKINYLQTRYKINDTIRFDKSGIKFRNIKFIDEKGNSALLSGSVNHKSFKDFSTDLIINIDKNPVLVLNTQEKDNDLFYGTAYATGVTTIKSGPNLLSFDISAKTGKGTKFNIPLNTGLSVSEYSFVKFVIPDTTQVKDEQRPLTAQIQSSGTKMEINFDLDVTPDAEVQLLIDPKAGDVIRGSGEGKLNMSLNKNDEFRIYGDYVIDEGEYLFTLKNILNKRFDVESGGKITFNGDVENADIDLTAKYKNLKTSLYPILQDERYNNRIPVEPQLILTGNLFNPVVVFNIYLPNADEETRTYLRNAIATEEELSRQFLYLLVMNSFYSDPSYRSSSGTASSGSSTSGTAAMAVTTTEMLSNQLSNWLSQISNDFDVGFLYRPGNKDINSQELQVALSTQLLNDKVTINGNFDVRGQDNPEGTPLTGDFDVEYKISEKIRFKVFNRYNSPYTGRGVPYTQGIGIFFKKDFDKFSDLLKKKEKPEMKKEDDVTVPE